MRNTNIQYTSALVFSFVCFSITAAEQVSAPKAITPVIAIATSNVPSVPLMESRLKRLEAVLSSQMFQEQNEQVQLLQKELVSLREQLDLQARQLEDKTPETTLLDEPTSPHIHANPGTISMYAAPANRHAPWMDAVAEPVVLPELELPIIAEEPVIVDVDGSKVYDDAFNLLKKGQYSKSVSAWNHFLQNYPDSKYKAQSHFWLGEAHYLQKKYSAAMTQFNVVINDYPLSRKKSDAFLKIAYTFYAAKDWSSARDSLNRVVDEYPRTVIAKKAKIRLQRMKKEGR